MTSRSSWIDSFSESAMATIRPMLAASPGSWGWLRIASRMALARGLDLGVPVITLLSPPGSPFAPGCFAEDLTAEWALRQPNYGRPSRVSEPSRVRLPPELPWIEVDFPAMVEEKERLMADAQPVCSLTRRGLDLSDSAARAVFFGELADTARSALIITEGLLLYMDEDVVRALALDLAGRSSIRWWVFDLASPNLLQMMKKTMGSQLVNAPMKFAPAAGVAFFEALGWVTQDVRSFVREAVRLHRLPWFLLPFAFLPEPDPRRLGNARWSAVIRLAKRPLGG